MLTSLAKYTSVVSDVSLRGYDSYKTKNVPPLQISKKPKLISQVIFHQDSPKATKSSSQEGRKTKMCLQKPSGYQLPASQADYLQLS